MCVAGWFTDWSYCIYLFSCITASLFNKLTYLLYLLKHFHICLVTLHYPTLQSKLLTHICKADVPDKCFFMKPKRFGHSIVICDWFNHLWVALPPSVLSTHHSHHPSPRHSFIPALKPSFPANPSHCSLPFLLQEWLHGFSGLFNDTSEHIRFFTFLVCLFFPLFSCWFRAVCLQCFDAVSLASGRASGL